MELACKEAAIPEIRFPRVEDTTMFKLNLVLAASHLTPALAFGAVPACVDMEMDAPSFSISHISGHTHIPYTVILYAVRTYRHSTHTDTPLSQG